MDLGYPGRVAVVTGGTSGIGLAAAQIGELQRLVVMDLSREGEEKAPKKFVNPEITERSGEWLGMLPSRPTSRSATVRTSSGSSAASMRSWSWSSSAAWSLDSPSSMHHESGAALP